MKYKYIIWDWNGTLLDDAALSVEVFNKMCDNFGLPNISLETYRADFKFPVIKFYEEHGYDFSKIDFQKVGHFYVSEYNKRRFKCKLQKGANEAMSELQKSGCRQSVLSAYEQNFLLKSVLRFEIDVYLDHIYGLDNILAGSKIGLGKSLMAKIGANPGDMIMIGDTEHDKSTADAMGIDCALVSVGHSNRKNLENSVRRFRFPFRPSRFSQKLKGGFFFSAKKFEKKLANVGEIYTFKGISVREGRAVTV